jgi:ribosomal-protein-alanine N-acetyltransferase
MTVTLTPLSPALADVAASLHAISELPESWDANAFIGLLSLPGVGGRIALLRDDPAGLILWRVAADEAEILTICVAPRHRRSGIGQRLLEDAATFMREHDVRTIFLEVAIDNRAAIKLYRKGGYGERGTRMAYYRTANGPTDALILAKTV